MGIAGVEEREATSVDRALDAFRSAVDGLVEAVEAGGCDVLDDEGFVRFLQDLERVRNGLALVDHRVVRDVEARNLPAKLTQPNVTAELSWALRLSRGEAARRVRAAEALGVRVAMTGEPLEPLRPALAGVQRAGMASPEQLDVCLRALAKVEHRGFDPADLEAADGLLAQFAAVFPPRELRTLAEQVVERIDPDGTRPQEDLNQDRRHLAFTRLRDGMWSVEGRLTGPVGAKLRAVLGPLAKPRLTTVVLDDGREVQQDDPRHHGQRTHDALEEVCDRLLRSGTLPDAGGTPSTVIVTIPEGDLVARRRWGVTSDGTVLSGGTVVDLTDEAEVYPTLVSPTGVVLQLGRSRRLATPGQTMALVARDGGCSFPGCDRPPEWCERHHVTAWVDGGATDLDNLTLLCAWHHHNFAGRGWTCLMVDGLPAWVPPRWVDPDQRPLRNVRVLARQRGEVLRR
ncbi:HNH endonuclease signature motif containing protein [Microlunatus spumicola]|uniref:HNH endonuclease signature motif containing protein n=1 Tax=Microlunatus spumicola TaxID=81499 RepID=A0ABP6X6F1_9ACTN